MKPNIQKTHKLFIAGKFARSESGLVFSQHRLPASSAKDFRSAVSASRAVQGPLSELSCFARSQQLYRAAEELQARSGEFTELGVSFSQISRALDSMIWHVGLADKLGAINSSVNPISSPHFSFTIPQPVGVVGMFLSDDFALALDHLAAAFISGNAITAIAQGDSRAILSLGEIFATSDFLPGSINLLSSPSSQVLSVASSHLDVDGLDLLGLSSDDQAQARLLGAAALKRIIPLISTLRSFALASAFTEIKTIWHPTGF